MKLLATLLTLLTLTGLATPAGAQSNPRYVQFQPRAVKGALYVPDSGPAPHVGILAASDVELPGVPRVPRAVEPGLYGVVHEPALRQQRSAGAVGEQRAR